MRYLMFICADGIPASDPEEEFAGKALATYVQESAPVRVFGHPLLGPETATTVRVRNGETVLSDGPFVETKEHMVGFDLIECADRDEAIRTAAAHPMAWFHRIEVRPCDPDGDEWTDTVLNRLRAEPSAGKGRYLMLVCVEPGRSENGAEPANSVDAWVNDHAANGTRIVGQVLDATDSAALVRVRGPHTLVTDGPFAETKEWVAGFDVIECGDLDDAVTIAAAHPMARSNMIEIRPFGNPRGVGD